MDAKDPHIEAGLFLRSVLEQGIIRLSPPPDWLVGQKLRVRLSVSPLVASRFVVVTVERLSVLEADGERSSAAFMGRREDGQLQRFTYGQVVEVIQ